MKKNLLKKIAALSLAAALCTTALMSGTMAKYVSSVEGSGLANIASFEYEVLAGDGVASEALNGQADLDLFSQRAGSLEENIKDSDSLVAPGSSGYFIIETVNSSEVAVDDTFVFTEVQENMPSGSFARIIYSFDVDGSGAIGMDEYFSDTVSTATTFPIVVNGTTLNVNLSRDIEDLANAVSDAYSEIGYAGDTGRDSSVDYKINWYWTFLDTDFSNALDTPLGVEAATGEPRVKFEIDATIAQID